MMPRGLYQQQLPSNMKFTDQEIEIIQDMVGFPDTYITTKGVDTIETILKKPETINNQK